MYVCKFNIYKIFLDWDLAHIFIFFTIYFPVFHDRLYWAVFVEHVTLFSLISLQYHLSPSFLFIHVHLLVNVFICILISLIIQYQEANAEFCSININRGNWDMFSGIERTSFLLQIFLFVKKFYASLYLIIYLIPMDWLLRNLFIMSSNNVFTFWC